MKSYNISTIMNLMYMVISFGIIYKNQALTVLMTKRFYITFREIMFSLALESCPLRVRSTSHFPVNNPE